jgi:predicted ATPase/DNA-binding CsgD family transcriptional regulator
MLVSFPGRHTSEAREAPEFPGVRPRRERRRAVQREHQHASLRLPATSLVGRVRELAHIDACLRLDGTGIRLLSLLGSPGTGKTRLGLEAAMRLADCFEEGVYFVDLSTVTDPDVVPAAIAHVLGATYTGRRQVSVADTLKRVLRSREVLLVLDNFECVLGAGPMLEDLLLACTGVKILVTSREPLHVASEQQYEVAPLATPDLQHLPALVACSQIEAVALFVERTRALRSGWELTADNAGAVAEICVQLDGLPLAIELAASWMNVLSPQAMVPELPHALRLLGTRGAPGPSRHQTLQATIDWSYDLLSDGERRLFRRLAVFENGWTLDGCSAVCVESGSDRAQALNLLGSLVDKHLVSRTEDAEGNVRFGLLQTIRTFAFERLVESGELAVSRRQHAAWCVALGEQAETELDSPAQTTWMERLEQERGNLRAALEWARTSTEREAAELGLRLAATLWLFWDVRGHMQEGREPLNDLLSLPLAQGRTLSRARALLAAGWLGYVKGDVAEVERVMEESLAIARDLGDAWCTARALAVLGTTLAAYTNDSDRTVAVLQEALEIARPLKDTWSIGFALYNFGVLAMRAGRLDEAERVLEECRILSAATENPFCMACTVFRLGWVAGARGDHGRALELLRESLRLNWRLRNRRVVALCLEQLACLGGGSGGPGDQARLFGAAETLFEQLPDYTLPPQMLEAHERGAAGARNVLGEPAFSDAWMAGRTLAIDQAVSLGLGLSAPRDEAVGGAVSRSRLTTRELGIVRLVAKGLTDQQVGNQLELSRHTVGNHMRSIFAKANVTSRTALVMWAVRSGIISTSD